MPHPTSIPTVLDIDQIKSNPDPVIRNLQITQCYFELSTVFTSRLGNSANWCTYATWASKQAGQTIRKEDLRRRLESAFQRAGTPMLSGSADALTAGQLSASQVGELRSVAGDENQFRTSIQRASDAVGRGNKKVFEEIGREFARFYATCLEDPTQDAEKIQQFCEPLRIGDAPEGQRYLQQAFRHYYQAMFEQDSRLKAELILTANIEIGFHEQTRLQPEIAESLDAGLNSILFILRALSRIYPYRGLIQMVHLYLMRLLQRPLLIDRLLIALLKSSRLLLRETITEVMMTLNLPTGVQLSLGDDLRASYPTLLQHITYPDLKALLENLDPTPDSPVDSGARDWADLPDRLHLIIELFRSHQETSDLFAPPFTEQQVRALKANRLPEGEL